MPKRKLITIDQIKVPSNSEYSLTRDGVTQSLLGTFLACEMRAMLSLNRWTLPETEFNFAFGTLCHEILDKIYTNFIKRPPAPRVVKSLIQDYIDEKKKDKFTLISDEKNDLYGSLAYVLLTEYLSYYKDDWKKKKFIEVEKVFNVPFGKYRLKGKRDGIFLEGKKKWVIDHKFYGQIDEGKLLTSLDLDFQTRFYYTAWKQESGKYPDGILYNVVRKPGNKPGANESFPEFETRIRKAMQQKPEYYFHRFRITITPESIKRFEAGLSQKLEDFQEFLNKDRKHIHCNEFSCDKPYPCQYQYACTTWKLGGYQQRKELFPEL